MNITQAPAWQELQAHYRRMASLHLRDFFTSDPSRFELFSCRDGKALVDFSKQRIDRDILNSLLDLARQAGVPEGIERLFSGARINRSEDRAALHVALRALPEDSFVLDGASVMPQVLATRQRMAAMADAIREGEWRGYSGDPIRHIVNLGIGGSDLGPRMATRALLAQSHPGLSVDFVSNLDAADLVPLLERLDPRTTLFIVASKTFTTLETLTNATTARHWLLEHARHAGPKGRDRALARQFIGVTASPEAASAFGLHPDNILSFENWVGGRYSVWSAIGLPVMLAIGPRAFEQFLSGARHQDQQFRYQPLESNLPVLMAMIGIWNINFLKAGNLSISPYSQSLQYLPDYLQQLEMESNGKQVAQDGSRLHCQTAPIIWGDAGTNTQHAYFQLLHQGERQIPSDFIAIACADFPVSGHHDALLANCLAQSEALAFGNATSETDPRRICPGNQPSTTLLLPRLDPFHLGWLLALYEHKTYVQALIWDINPFDQWGVELGKQLARRLIPAVSGKHPPPERLDSSTRGLLNWLNTSRN